MYNLYLLIMFAEKINWTQKGAEMWFYVGWNDNIYLGVLVLRSFG